MIRVQAPSRLHFGLFSLGGAARWPDAQGDPTLPARRFGGAGLMVQEPGLCLAVEPAADWSAAGPLAERALDFGRQLAATLPADIAVPLRIVVEQAGPAHAGLGTGTQLALAVGQAALQAWQQPPLAAVELARRVGRGARSALGIHGFAQGGFLVDGGKKDGSGVAPLVARSDFPEDWRIVLAIPTWAQGLHGARERQAFQHLLDRGAAPGTTDALCRLVLLGMLPALAEQDLDAFGAALYDFNRRVGELFAPVQGGPYAHPRLAELVEFIRRQGVRGAGQSSWGPTVFAVTGDRQQAEELVGKIGERFSLAAGAVLVTSSSRGAEIEGLMPNDE